jgi:hypothetical protein
MGSFLCERTIEYAVVPRARKLMAETYSLVVPIFFWKTREGSALSLAIHEETQVSLFALFARRPKLYLPRPELRGKINAELFAFGRAASSMGIVSMAAMPVIKCLADLYSEPTLLWFDLARDTSEDYEFTWDDSGLNRIYADGQAVRTVPENAVASITKSMSAVFPWKHAVDVMGELRSYLRREYSFFQFGGYKPVYFALAV